MSVELVAQQLDGSIKVRVRFDDVDITNDTRWCADTIVLNPVPTASGRSLNVTSPNTLLLDQGTTATRRTGSMLYNGVRIFTGWTLMRCRPGSWLNVEGGASLVVDHVSTLDLQGGSKLTLAPNAHASVDHSSALTVQSGARLVLEANSQLVITRNSGLRLMPGARLDVAAGAQLIVTGNGRLELEPGSMLAVADGGWVHIEEETGYGDGPGRMYYHRDAVIELNGPMAEVAFSGYLQLVDSATFAPVSVGHNYTQGRVRFNGFNSYNLVADPGCRFVLKGLAKANRVLYVDQESLYCPKELDEFTLMNGTATLAPNARIVTSDLNADCLVNFINARVTSKDMYQNSHRGVWTFGQAGLTVQNTEFSNGEYRSPCLCRPLAAFPAHAHGLPLRQLCRRRIHLYAGHRRHAL
ncbi:MAG: hypothetical protein QM724_05630 [Flavobacteriales bacterium]